MSVNWRKFSYIAAGAFLLFALSTILFLYLTIQEIPFNRLELYQVNERGELALGEAGELQSSSIVNKDLLANFLLFSRDSHGAEARIGDWINEKILTRKGPISLEVQTDLKLPLLLKNHCEDLYCYQHKMSFREIPSILWKGLIGIEDSRFLDHRGVDWRSIMRALVSDLKEMRFVQGGSTITQQLVKNLFLSNEKTVIRKIREMIIALYIEEVYSKENILESYFNEVVWGALEGIRIKGVFAASAFYFSKKPSELDEFEATILISLLKGPAFFHPIRHAERLKARAHLVYEILKEQGHYSSEFQVQWSDSEWDDWMKSLKQKTESQAKRNMWRSLVTGPQKMDQFDHYIITHSIERVLTESKEKTTGDLAAKLLIVDLAGGSSEEVFRYYTKYERLTAPAIENERHMVGSIFKPYFYQYLLALGADTERPIQTGEIQLKLKSGRWSPRELAKNLPETVSMAEALKRSLNRPLIHLAQEIGWDELGEKLGARIPRFLKPLSEYPSQLLGAMELTMPEILDLYRDFISVECSRPDWSEGPMGWLLDPTQTTLQRVIRPELKGIEFFSKTGTSNDGLDNLFLFYDGRWLGVIWFGVDGSREGLSGTNFFGSTTAFAIYQSFIMQRGKRFTEFECP